jgi:hypothetical protein
MKNEKVTLLQVGLELRVLKALALEPLHGLGDIVSHRADDQGHLCGEAGLLFSRSASDGGPDGFLLLGRVRKQPPGKVLSVDESRRAATQV